jgi:hypothetical protein
MNLRPAILPALSFVAACFCLMTGTATADSFSTSVGIDGGPENIYVCNTLSFTSNSTCAYNTAGDTSTGTAVANLAAGTLGDSAQITVSGGAVGDVGAGTSLIYIFNGQGPGMLQFSLSADGTETGPYSEPGGNVFGTEVDLGLSAQDVFAPGTAGLVANAGTPILVLNNGTTNFLVDVPVVDGTAELYLSLSAGAFCDVPMTTCSNSALFQNTVAITGVQAFDPNGNLIPDANVISEGGFNPNSPSVSTPEPTTIMLLSIGLVGLAGTKRKMLA